MKTNLSGMQQIYVMTGSEKRRGLLAKKHPSILFRERGITFQLTIGTNNWITSGY